MTCAITIREAGILARALRQKAQLYQTGSPAWRHFRDRADSLEAYSRGGPAPSIPDDPDYRTDRLCAT